MKNLIFGTLKLVNTKKLNFWEKYMRSYGRSVKDGYKTNAFSPLAWYVFFLIIPLVVLLMIIKNEIIQYVILGIIGLIIIFPLIMYVVIFKKDPKLLQSEKFRIEDRKMDIIAEKGGSFNIIPYDLTESKSLDQPKDIDG